MRRSLFSRHYAWAWVFHAIFFGSLLALSYQLHRVDQRGAQEAIEEHMSDVAKALAAGLRQFSDHGHVDESAQLQFEDLLNEIPSLLIRQIRLLSPSGDVIASVGESFQGSASESHVVTHVVRVQQSSKSSGPTMVPLKLEITVDDRDLEQNFGRRTSIFILLAGLIVYVWMRESLLARRRYLEWTSSSGVGA